MLSMNKKEESFDVSHEPVSYEMSLYFLRHFTIALEKIRSQEIERYVKKLSGNEKQLAENFTTEYIRKIVNNTAIQIRAMSENSDVKRISIALAELFNAESPFLTKTIQKRV
jgi:hypothetical protein